MGEDKYEEEVEGVEEEEAKEAPIQVEPKKRKDKAQLMVKIREKKVINPSLAKPTALTTRESTQATTQKAKEQDKEKTKATKRRTNVE